jgi:nicotinamide-nucleotide amidase
MKDERLQARLVSLLLTREQTITTAESCTGGLVGKSITDISGSSAVYPGGVISYSGRIKHQLLQVPEEMLQQFGAVSEQVANAMAQGVRTLMGADYGLSVTGIAGPNSDETGKPVGLVYVALASPTGVYCRELHLAGDRDSIRCQAAECAMKLALEQIEIER